MNASLLCCGSSIFRSCLWLASCASSSRVLRASASSNACTPMRLTTKERRIGQERTRNCSASAVAASALRCSSSALAWLRRSSCTHSEVRANVVQRVTASHLRTSSRRVHRSSSTAFSPTICALSFAMADIARQTEASRLRVVTSMG